MSLSAFFIKRPVGTTLLAIGVMLAGIIGFNLLPVAPLPQMDFPTISVQASLPGASPETMASSVATPLERQLGVIAGVTEMTSSSTLGSTRITVQFDLSRNIDGAARDVQAAITATRSFLPTNLPSNPTYRKVNPADAPIMILALTSDRFTSGQMYDAASTVLSQKIAQIDGIGQVIVGGSSLPAVRVELNPAALSKYGISLQQVRQTIANANSTRPKGQLSNALQSTELQTSDQIFHAYEYRPLIVAYRNQMPVRIADVGEVVDSVQDLRNAGLANGKPAVLLVLFKQPGANVIETVDRVKQMIPILKASLQNGIDLNVMMDRTTTIRAALHDVEITLILSVILVVLVIYLFLGNVRAMLIPSVAMTLSLVGTFSVMWLLGYSLNALSLMALTIATGFVVDDAIVMVENISRHLEAGMKPLQAAIIGAQEVGFTVFSMSLSLIAVFIPLLLMGGIIGRLLREFSVTLAVAILVSLIVSLTVTPMMTARILRRAPQDPAGWTLWLLEKYRVSLRWALHYPRFLLCLTGCAIGLSVLLFCYVPKGFFPQQDTGRISASIQAQQNISFQSMKKKLQDYVAIIQQDPAVQNVVGFVGGNNNTSNRGTIFIMLKPLSQRNVSPDDVINRLRTKLATVVGATLYMQAVQDLVIGGRASNAQYQYTLSSSDLLSLNQWTPRVKEKIATLPGIIDVNSDQLDHGLQAYVKVDRDTAGRFGITSKLVDSTLYDAFGQSIASTMYKAMNQYYVVMEVAPPYWQNPDILHDLYVISPAGQQVPLSTIASFSTSSTLLSVNHQGQLPAATISFNLVKNGSLGDAVNKILDAVADMQLPPVIQTAFKGTAQAFQDSLSNQAMLILAALLAAYIILGILYESFVHPLTILSTLPSAGVGALLALLLFGMDLNLIAIIGIILLIGIVKKNAIMMIDFALHAERIEKKPIQEAIYEAAVLRFRPIMMTTMAAMLGAVPLAIGIGAGSELRRPLGIAIIGGLLVSQMLTLYTTPVVYLTLEKWAFWFRNKIILWKKHLNYSQS